MAVTTDVAAERAVLAGICQHGSTMFLDVTDLVKPNSFSVDSNKIIFKCIENICKKESVESIDLPSILSSAKELSLDHILEKKDEFRHLNSVLQLSVNEQSVRRFAAKLRRLEIARLLHNQGALLQEKMSEVDGTETVSQLLGIAESVVFDFTSLFENEGDLKAIPIGDSIEEYVEYLIENPGDIRGISTGLPMFDEAIGGGLLPGVTMIGARAKVGKMQPLYSIVYTPDGPTQMGDLQIGDLVCTPDGSTAPILEIIEHKNQDIYRVYMNDGSYMDCGLEHLFKVKHTRHKEYKILSLEDILKYGNGKLHEKNRPKWRIPLTEDVDFNERAVPIDPYIFGLLLGDGSFSGTISLTTTDDFIVNKLSEDLPNQYFLRKSGITYFPTDGKKKTSNEYREHIRNLGLWNTTSHTKFIPINYLLNSKKNRLLLLQGLLDTDGGLSNKKGNVIEYSTVSNSLADGVKFLAESLGCIVRKKERTVDGFHSYRLSIHSNDPSKFFQLPRKKQSCKKRIKGDLTRSIIKVEKLKDKKDCRCIYIDHSDHLYLTDNFIVTHNTTLSVNIAKNIGEQNIPVLYLDTEMVETGKYRDISLKMLSMISDVDINDIKSGAISEDPVKQRKVREAAEWIKNHKNITRIGISGKPFEDQLYAIRRWIQSNVGLNPDGTAKDCVIIYDYLKLMDGAGVNEAMREFQLLGMMMTALQSMAVRYAVPILSFTQLNRDGLDGEHAGVVAGSDRITWFCTAFCIFKYKSPDEIAEDGPEMGNRKIVVVLSRYGPGHDFGEYCNLSMNKYKAQIIEVDEGGAENVGDFFEVIDGEGDEMEIPFG